MKQGLSTPPVEAPVLPDGYFYRIRHFKDSHEGTVNWYVQIRKQGRFGHGRVVSSAKSAPSRWLGKRGLNRACIEAYDELVRNLDNEKAAREYKGKWSSW